MRLTSSLMFSVEAVVQPPGSEQVVVRATLGNAAFVQHGDAVGLTDRRNAVRYDKDSRVRQPLPQPAQDVGFRLRIERRRGFVEHHHRSLLEECSGDGQALALAAR